MANDIFEYSSKGGEKIHLLYYIILNSDPQINCEISITDTEPQIKPRIDEGWIVVRT